MSSNILTMEQIREQAPAVFEEYPSNTVNAFKYQMIHTKDILEPMDSLGWNVVHASQRRTRKAEWEDKTYHVLRFRNPNIKIGDDYLEIVVGNSHNASTSFKIQIGVYRLVCSNGLTIGDDLVSPLIMQHTGLSSEIITKMAQMYVELTMNNINESIGRMKEIILDRPKQIELAKVGSKLKHKDEYEVNTFELLEPRRYEDRKEDLWTVYNVIQENLMLGDYTIKGANGKWRKARAVNSPMSNVEINTKLFNLALKEVA